MTDLFEEIVRMRRAGARGALATIVHTNGSIPSYESSRMLVREDGSIAGTIGGGCVEADVWAAAKEVMLHVPPMPEQRAIIATVDSLREETERLASLYERKLAALEALKRSLLHQAFTGNL